MINELKELNDTFYAIFEDLKDARPSLAGCDEAFLSIARKILEQYELEYRLLDLQLRVGTEQTIAKLEARYDRQVPKRWRTRFFRRRKQNYAMTLTDIEADEEAKKYYTDFMKRINDLAAKMQLDEQKPEQTEEQTSNNVQASEGGDGEWEIVDEGTSEQAEENVSGEAPEQAETPAESTEVEASDNVGSEDPPQEESAENAQSEEAPKKKKEKRRKRKGGE